MKRNNKLTKQETQSAARIGKRLVNQVGLEDMTEGDILDVVCVAVDAIGLADEKFHVFKLMVYKTILEQKPDYKKRLVNSFYREVMASNN